MTTLSQESLTLVQQVEQALDSIRPYLLADGGDVRVIDITEDKIVRLELLGQCSSCSMSAMTLKAGVEESIRRALPEIKGVEAVNMTGIE